MAELIGTTILVWIGAGTAALNGMLANQNHHPVTLADIGMMSLAFGIVVVMIAAFGHISGCHSSRGHSGTSRDRPFLWREVPAYVIAQALGVILGTLGILPFAGYAHRGGNAASKVIERNG